MLLTILVTTKLVLLQELWPSQLGTTHLTFDPLQGLTNRDTTSD